MIGYQNLHSHTYFDDGKCSADEMVKGALAAGLTSIGICCHSPILSQKCNWAISQKDIPAFQQEVFAAREKYRGIIDVFCGIEYDLLSGIWVEPKDFDYCIGATHYLPLPMGENQFLYSEVDTSKEALADLVSRIYHGNSDSAAEFFYAQYQLLAENKDVDIVAHFDLITKFDEIGVTPEKEMIFNQKSSSYMSAAMEAMRLLVRYDKIFEINTGAVSRGYRKTFYPAIPLLKELHRLGGRVTLSTDAHVPQNAGFGLDEALKLAESCGFKEIWQLKQDGFKPVKTTAFF